MHSHLRGVLIPVLAITTVMVLGGCKDETAPETHHPVSVRLFDATTGAELTPNVQLASGATTRVRVRFHAADGDSISGIEADHYTALTFNPPTFATVAAVVGQNFQIDVTVAAAPAVTAQLTVGYGHDVNADDDSFGPFTVTATVNATGLQAPVARVHR
jgi:hypothetical protein